MTSLNYQALYRKYRSQTFADLVGQEATSRALQGAILSGRVTHAYLFSGTRGTGKTSTARLLAKALNCSERTADSAEPCERCDSCRAMTAGTALDLIEIDAASNRGIDEIRDLREKVNLAPAQGARKIYIIDEAHMLTTEAFNALLKTLEEPPEHVVFVLCTTEANKIPPTVLGRCQQFVFRRHTEEQMVGRLAYIAEREQVEVDREAFGLMAAVAQGSMRDAVGLLDQLIPLANGPITLPLARELLGLADPGRLDELLAQVLDGSAGAALATLTGIYDSGGELRQVVRGLMERCRDQLVASIEQGDTGLRDRLSAVLDGLLHLDGEVRRHAEPRFLVEATLVRLSVEVGADARPRASRDGTAAPPPERAPAPVPVPAPPPPPVQRERPDRAPERAAPTRPEPNVAPLEAARPDPDRAAVAPAQPAPPQPPRQSESAMVAPPPAAPPQPPPEPGPAAGPPEDVGPGVQEQWDRILQALGPKLRAFFKEGRLSVQGTRVTLLFPYSFHHKMAVENAGELLPHLRRWLGDSATLDLTLKEATPAAPAQRRPIAPEEDPVVQEAVRKFEGRVTRVKETKT